jgi:hypothetical protein
LIYIPGITVWEDIRGGSIKSKMIFIHFKSVFPVHFPAGVSLGEGIVYKKFLPGLYLRAVFKKLCVKTCSGEGILWGTIPSCRINLFYIRHAGY